MSRPLAAIRLAKSLFGRTLLILLVGLVVSNVIAAWIYAGAREQAVGAVGGYEAALRIANLTRLVEEAPAEWRARIAQGLSEPNFRVSLSASAPELPAAEGGAAQAIRDAVLAQLPNWPGREAQVVVAGPAIERTRRAGAAQEFASPGAGMGGMGEMNAMMGRMMGPAYVDPGFGAWRTLQAAIRLGDGRWLSFVTGLPQSGPATPWRFLVAMVAMDLAVLVVSAWAARSVTAPLGLMAAAADRVGRDVAASPLAEAGTAEMQTAARAFNLMQERLRRLIETRTRMLAALSHDLRTPLTLLRLRAEEVAEPVERERMLATIGEMDAMIGSTLAFARDETHAEPRRRVDLAALTASLVDDMADAGLPVTMKPIAPLAYECQPAALKRAIANLLDNAVKYGKRAEVSIARLPQAVEISVDDEGPGIPESEIPKVVEPFYRLDGSRGQGGGGSGLGLALAQSTALAHGGELKLCNRPGGGLRAAVRLPL